MQPRSLDLALLLVFCLAPVIAFQPPLNKNHLNSCQDSSFKTCFPLDCKDVYDSEFTADGVYLIFPNGRYSAPVPVYCDMTSANGPWTKRFDGSEDFNRGWEDYKAGFGQADSEYWLGLENIYQLTLRRSYRLRIDLTDYDNDARFVTYNTFSLSPLAISGVEKSYKLYIDGFKEGDSSRPAGDSLRDHNGMAFSTHDRDRDTWPGNCASVTKGAFWYYGCTSTNLNGLYSKDPTCLTRFQYCMMTWLSWRSSSQHPLKAAQMKIAVN
ncbi:microfibril-associated glycoprotein 4-like isoform X2 [Rana temporaria]|uniref:microfibril-associated glycoprotein 4-like isoform X2 n=1 Tax=Rana temporaria TaxID=8407 RepID=UPI001AAC4DA7|nr:microfibril-associated glycoprotein 4-like isoform X2 [Rana temporaria]